MSLSITSSTGALAAAYAHNFEKLPPDPARPTPPPAGNPSRALTAMGAKSIGLTPNEVKALSESYVPEAQKIVDDMFAKYIVSKPKLETKYWTPQELTAAKKSNVESLFAFVDSKAPATINIGYQSVIFKKFGIDANDTKTLLTHEVLHTRSAAFALDIARTYGKPLADGKPARFSDGSQVRGVTEGLTEIFTMQALKVDATPSGYSKETKWAARLIDKVDKLTGEQGMETVKKAYFGNDIVAMTQVKKAITELVEADKKAPESPSARSGPRSPIARLLSVGTGRST